MAVALRRMILSLYILAITLAKRRKSRRTESFVNDPVRPKAGIQTAYRYDIQVTATFRERTVGPPTLCQLIGLTRYSTSCSNTA
jgi:hypothetical protein